MRRAANRRTTAGGMITLVALAMAVLPPAPVGAAPDQWRGEWPDTDFSRHSVALDEIFSGGPPKDGIPAIDHPAFRATSAVTGLGPDEPVIGLAINGEAKAYPLRILIWHEIVNDSLGGVPVTVTFCPLCNSAIVFERRLDGRLFDFGTTGKLRNSDLVMYDRQTLSWWQQFLGQGIVGEMTGKSLKMLPSRLESFSRFKARHPGAQVMVPNGRFSRPYGQNPYAGYDGRDAPYPFFVGELPPGVPAMMRVVAVGGRAWTLPLLRKLGRIREHGLEITWSPGQNSALDSRAIASGRDVGNVSVTRAGKDIVHDIIFAFVFHAFHPDGVIIK